MNAINKNIYLIYALGEGEAAVTLSEVPTCLMLLLFKAIHVNKCFKLVQSYTFSQ